MNLATHALVLGVAMAFAPACSSPTVTRPSARAIHRSPSNNCDEPRYREDREIVCERRTISIDHRDLAVDSSPNGGVEVESWDRGHIEIVAEVKAVARTAEEAQRLVDDTRIQSGGVVRAIIPSEADRPGGGQNSVSVSYTVRVPRSTNLDLSSVNGGVAVSGVAGEIRLRSVNGGISVNDVNGDVDARTTNGGITVALSGNRWEGNGLAIQTTNGGVTMSVPSDYSANLSVSTRNGGISLDDVLPRNGDVRRGGDTHRFEGELGRGGAPIRAETANGGIRVRRR